jgi:hypothetical protein
MKKSITRPDRKATVLLNEDGNYNIAFERIFAPEENTTIPPAVWGIKDGLLMLMITLSPEGLKDLHTLLGEVVAEMD